MSRELYWLSLTLAATALFWAPYVLNRMAVRGLIGTMANPSPNDAPLAPWAERAKRAHSLAFFGCWAGIVILVARLLGLM